MPDDVGLHHVVRVLIRVRNRDQSPEVEDPLPARDGLADGLGILQVAAMDLDLGLDVGRQIVEVAAVVAAVVAHQDPDLVAVADQSLGQVTADEPPCPGHQDRLAHGLAAPCGHASE